MRDTKCSECNETFRQVSSLQTRCPSCQKLFRKEWKKQRYRSSGKLLAKDYYRKNKTYIQQCYRQWQQSIEGIFSTYKRNAKKRNIPWELSYAEFKELVECSCHYCGIIATPYNGIDRLDSTKGYSYDNCVPCCIICNQMKLDYSKEFFLSQCKRIINYRGVH